MLNRDPREADATGDGSSHPVPASVFIPARSERQAMEWSLALASQQIVCVIHPPRDEHGWALEVESSDSVRALRTLRLYQVENRRRSGALTPSVGELAFHWGVLLWCLLMIVIYWASDAPGSRLHDEGGFITTAVREGELWRALTATFLHAGLEHLVANLTTGFLLIGLAMGRFGVGTTLLGTALAGAAGNLFAWFWRASDYHGLGASGVVMGALGMLAVSLVGDTLAGRISARTLRRGLLGGALLFILLGTSPQSDVLAHAGGFLAGAAVGGLVTLLPVRWLESTRWDAGCAVAYVVLSVWAWMLAVW